MLYNHTAGDKDPDRDTIRVLLSDPLGFSLALLCGESVDEGDERQSYDMRRH